MRSFLEPPRKRKRPSDRFQGRFGKVRSGTGGGGRDLIRFRRNRELLAREATMTLLWGALAVMLLLMLQALWRVSEAHWTQQSTLLRLGLPAIPLVGALLCVLRVRRSFLELMDIRREQREVVARLQSLRDDLHDGS